MGRPDITVLSFAIIGHVGRNSQKFISAQGTRAGIASSIPPFVPGSGQPPPKSGRVRVCPFVSKAFPDGPIRRLANQKPAFGNPTERNSFRKLGLRSNFAEEASSRRPLSRGASSRRALAPSSRSQPFRASHACPPPPAQNKTHAWEGLLILYDSDFVRRSSDPWLLRMTSFTPQRLSRRPASLLSKRAPTFTFKNPR
jgi:hypothetical protein